MKSLREQVNKSQKLIIFGIIGFCFLFADFRLFLGPAIGSLKKTSPQVRELQRKFNFIQNAVTNIPKYEEQIRKLDDKLSLHKKKFSTQQQISLLLQKLSTMAKNSGVKIIAVRPYPPITKTQEDVSTGVYQRFPISIRALCGYHQLGKFLSKLEDADIFMRVTDIRVTSDTKDPQEQGAYVLVNTYIMTESTGT